MNKKIMIITLIGVFAVLSTFGCSKKADNVSDEIRETDTVSEESQEAAAEEEKESTEIVVDENDGFVRLTEGENEFTDAVYEYAKELDVMKEGEFASYLVDFDDDEKKEAFVLRGHKDEEDDTRWYSATVWFVNENLEVDQLFGWYSPNVTYFSEEEFKDVEGSKCFYLSGYDVYDKNNFCYMYMLKNDSIVDVTDDINGKNQPFESKYTEEELSAMTPQQLFDAFCAGEIQAEFADIDGKTGYIDTRDWGWSEDDMNDYQKVIEPYDLDNDGELEYIIDTMYGMMCFDCKNGKVVMFADGNGTASFSRYITYEDATWIVYQDTTHEGRCTYQLYKFDGDLQIVDSMNLYWNEDDNENRTYYHNDKEVSEDEYNEYYKKIFGGSPL